MENTPAAFTQLLDRGISAEVELAAWCPTMDLLALVTVDGQLHVHRLNWQRLWWTAPEATVTAMAWHPDGKQLAVGLEDGQLLLLNTEDGEVLRKAQLFADESVAAIAWTAQQQQPAAVAATPAAQEGVDEGAKSAGAVPSLEDRTRRLLRPLSLPSTSGGLGAAAAGVGGAGGGPGYAGLPPAADAPGPGGRGAAWPAQPAQPTLLACASESGQLVLSTGGLFQLAGLDLRPLLGSQSGQDAASALRVLRLAVSSTLREMVVCWEEAAEGGGLLKLSRLDLGQLGPLAPLLHQQGLVAVDLTSLLSGCAAAWESACGEWATGMREVQESAAKLTQLLQDYGGLGGGHEGGAAAEELSRALATGIIGGALQQYFTASLGEAGVKRLARAVDAAVHAVHAALIDAVAPAAQLAAFLLGELRGLAAPCNAPALSALGLSVDKVGAAEGAALGLLLDVERLRRRVVAVGAQYRVLFIWLLIQVRRVTEDQPDSMLGYPRNHMDLLADFLRREFQRDSVGPAMKGAPPQEPGTPPFAAGLGGGSAAGGPALSLVLDVLAQYQGSTSSSTGGADNTPADGRASAAQPSQRPLLRGGGLTEQLATLSALCEQALDGTAEALTPGVRLAETLSLGPAPSSLAIEYRQHQQQPEKPGQQGERACVCACWRAEGLRRVLLLRAAAQDGGTQVEGALLELPAAESPVDGGFYKDGRVLLGVSALAPGGSDSSEAGGGQDQAAQSSWVAMLGPEGGEEHEKEAGGLEYRELPREALQGAGASIVQALAEAAPPKGLPAGCRRRLLPYPALHPPMAVSASRGVACLLVGTQRVIFLDLEEDEEEGGAEEEEGGEEMEG